MTRTDSTTEWIAAKLRAIDPHDARADELAAELLTMAEDCGAPPMSVSMYLHDPDRKKPPSLASFHAWLKIRELGQPGGPRR